jgi:glyoxylase-like metal-dependent hydrolase (beta-lactamase superfamily II)
MFIVGEESHEMCSPGYPEDARADVASDVLPTDRTHHQSRKDWRPVGPFPLAHDFFGDGSMYLVDAPGHCPGHMNLLVRTSSDGAWLYLAGDALHDRRLLTGEYTMATKTAEDGTVSAILHKDKEVAEATIERIKALEKKPRVKVILAHDKEWYAENKGGSAFWPGKIPSLS